MSVQLFSISTEANAWIIEILKKGVEDPSTESGVRAFKPRLVFSYGYTMWEEGHGKLLERSDEVCFDIGWDPADEIDPGGYHQVEIGGFKVLVHHTTLKELEGKELILEEVEVGYPIPASKKCQLLRARPKDSGDRKQAEDGSTIS